MTILVIPEIEQARVALEALALKSEAVESAAKAIIQTLDNGGKLLICGNGGSAADSQHMAGEFVSSFTHGLARRALPAIALTTDTSILTAYGNDFDFEGVFSRQVEAHGLPGDSLFAISTSGRSRNVLAAAQAGKRLGLTVIALTGCGASELTGLADISINVCGPDTQAIQTAHLVAEHAICRMVDEYFIAKETES